MPVYFSFTRTDPFVKNLKRGLSATEIRAVTRWQNTDLEYDFSFHELHTAGHPVYVCKNDGHGQRNMTKADVKDKTADQIGWVNGEKLLKKQLEDAGAVLGDNLAAFQKLAKNYYEGVDDLPVPNIPAPRLNCRQCNADITNVKVTKGKRVCPSCSKWN
jgi:hypothetical protein